MRQRVHVRGTGSPAAAPGHFAGYTTHLSETGPLRFGDAREWAIAGGALRYGHAVLDGSYPGTATLQPNQAWGTITRSGGASGQTTGNWSYAGSGGYSKDYGAVNGTLCESGSNSFSMGYETIAFPPAKVVSSEPANWRALSDMTQRFLKKPLVLADGFDVVE